MYAFDCEHTEAVGWSPKAHVLTHYKRITPHHTEQATRMAKV